VFAIALGFLLGFKVDEEQPRAQKAIVNPQAKDSSTSRPRMEISIHLYQTNRTRVTTV